MTDAAALKLCSECGIAKPLDRFHKSGVTAGGKPHWQGRCKPCRTLYYRAWRKTPRGREAMLRAKFKSVYGITLDDFDAMVEKQHGVCAICHRPNGKKRLAVDHDHTTGAVRGLLCDPCNMGIGSLRDDPDVLAAAADYLRSYN